jgi:Domain of unknown function (DUF1841)
MSSSIARRREAKAKRRKQVLAERRRQAHAEAGDPPAELAPIECCLLQTGLFDTGMGMMLLARGTPSTGLTMATFLLDVFCLGVKDVWIREIEASELDEYVAAMEIAAPLEDVEPAYARKLLRGAVAYARSLGFHPPRDYRAAELLFGDVFTDTCEVHFEFGCDGKPFYVPGPNDTPAQVRLRLEQLRRSVGEGGFDFAVDVDQAEGDSDFEDDGLFEGYDPDVAPDPGEWLGLDEDERNLRIEYYHRREGTDLEDERLSVHAILHAAVETQIAQDDPSIVGPTLKRLMAEGLDRHDAIHAVGSVVAELINEAVRRSEPFSTDEYWARLERLTAESWRALAEEEAGVEEP